MCSFDNFILHRIDWWCSRIRKKKDGKYFLLISIIRRKIPHSFWQKEEEDLSVASPQLFMVELPLVLSFSSWVHDFFKQIFYLEYYTT